MKLRFFLPYTLCLMSLLAFGNDAEQYSDKPPNQPPPFTAGERLIYTLKWGMFSVGEATLEVLNETDVFGEPAYQIRFKVRTNDFADKFYKVRTHIESFPSLTMDRSMHYRSHQSEGKREKSFSVFFNWLDKQVTRVENGVLRTPLEPKGPMHDPLSILFYFRTQELVAGTLLPLPATDGKKLINVDAKIESEESIKVVAGRFNTFKVQPNLKDLGGVFRKSKGAALEIWFSADDRRIPVRLKSRVRVGSFRADLKKIERFTPTPHDEAEKDKILKEIEEPLKAAQAHSTTQEE